VSRFSGQTAVVTGASSGIGKATAARFLEEGARVVIVSDRPDDVHEAAEELSRLGEVKPAVCDVSDEQSMQALARAVESEQPATIVVCNAGIWEEASIDEIDAARFERMLRVNATGAFVTARAFIAQIANQGGGAIVATASTNGLVAEPRLAHYNASKGALVMLIRSLAIDLAPRRIRVNAVAPGTIRTPLIAHILDATPEGHFGSIPWGRFGDASEVASCIAFLASEDASYVTGSVLVCDGGQTALNGPLPEDAS
jgi:NAD(P)-dependent dehydrogenase (short-subunit alcohol dehydrogenase family)